MDFPHRHGHGHGHGRRDDDDDESDRRAPAPGYGAPAPAYGRDDEYGRHAPAPAYGAPAPAYGGGREDDYGRHAPAPAYGAPAPAYGREDDYGRHAPAPAYGGGGGYGAPAPAAYGGGGGREDDYGRHAPAPAYGGGGGGREDDYGRHAPAPAYGGGYGAPAHGNVVHVSHESGGERPHYGGNETRPHHGGGGSATPAQQTYRIVCKAGEDSFSLGTRGGKVCLVRTDENDDAQHWIKDMKFSTRVKDEEGYPAIVLVNKATGEALKHSLGQSHPVLLTRYNPDSLDESVLWTESRDVGEGYRCIRMVNNIYLNFDALNGDKDHGGVRDGTTLVLWEWAEGDNQRWKIVAWCKFSWEESTAPSD